MERSRTLKVSRSWYAQVSSFLNQGLEGGISARSDRDQTEINLGEEEEIERGISHLF